MYAERREVRKRRGFAHSAHTTPLLCDSGGSWPAGDVVLLDAECNAVPTWRWSEVVNLSSKEDLGQFRLRVTSPARKRYAKGW